MAPWPKVLATVSTAMSRLSPMRAPLAMLIVVGLAAAGCGGDGDSDDGGTSAKTATERPASSYVAALDALCKRTNESGRKANARAQEIGHSGLPPAEQFRQVAAVIRGEVELEDGLISEAEALNVPAAEREFHDRFLTTVRRTVAIQRKLARAADAQDKAAMTRVAAEGTAVSRQRAQLVADHGEFEECGSQAASG